MAIRFETARLHHNVRNMPNTLETWQTTNKHVFVAELRNGPSSVMRYAINFPQWCRRQGTVLTCVALPRTMFLDHNSPDAGVDMTARLHRELV